MTRALDIRIGAARDHGFVAWEGGEVIAAFDNPQELAMWIEARAMQVEGEAARFNDETKTDFPNVIQAQPRRGLFNRGNR
jgi:hypothetical protein